MGLGEAFDSVRYQIVKVKNGASEDQMWSLRVNLTWGPNRKTTPRVLRDHGKTWAYGSRRHPSYQKVIQTDIIFAEQLREVRWSGGGGGGGGGVDTRIPHP
ncbi:hypothetical protein TWF481_010121 [Arthrobotrys musiformis]|uniref:Uncharacterized protein n=1 Tax=Arthrobotrys musiformis TaxID=47236 RepID=A0AAV9W2P4_9PEZI